MGNPRNSRLQHWLACFSDRGHSAFTLLLFLGLMLLIYGSYAGVAFPIQDDWWILAEAQRHPQLADLLQYWFQTIAHRPVYAVLLSVTSHLFGENVWAFVLLTSTFWWAAALVAAHGLRWSQSTKMRWCFAITATLPVIAASVVCSGVQMIAQTFSVFLWASAFALQMKALYQDRLAPYVFSFICATASLLTYEAVLPLIVFCAAFSSFEVNRLTAENHTTRASNLWAGFTKTSPQWGAFLTVLVYKVIMSLTADTFLSKVEHRSWAERLLSLTDWLGALLVSHALAFFSILTSPDTVQVLTSPVLWIGLVLLILLYIMIFSGRPDIRQTLTGSPRSLLISVVIGVLSSSLIFAISGQSARVEGLGSRLWIGVWVLLSLPIAVGMAKLGVKNGGIVICSFISAVLLLSLMAQMRCYLRSAQIAEVVVQDLYHLASTEGLGKGDSIVAIVPRYRLDNVNNEPILEEAYLEHVMAVAHPDANWSAFALFLPIIWVNDETLIPKGHFDQSYLRWEGNGVTAYRPLGATWKRPQTDSVWLYTFDLALSQGTLRPVSSPAELEDMLRDINQATLNHHRKTLSETLRDLAKQTISRYITIVRTAAPAG